MPSKSIFNLKFTTTMGTTVAWWVVFGFNMSLQIGRMFFRKPTGSTVELAIHFANEIFKCVNSCNKIGIQLKNLIIFECKNIISNIYCLTPTYPKTTKVQTQTNQFSCHSHFCKKTITQNNFFYHDGWKIWIHFILHKYAHI